MHNIIIIGNHYPFTSDQPALSHVQFIPPEPSSDNLEQLKQAHIIIVDANSFSDHPLAHASLLRSQNVLPSQVWMYIQHREQLENIKNCYSEGFDNVLSSAESSELFHGILRSQVLYEQRQQYQEQLTLAQQTARTALMNNSELGSIVTLLTDIIRVDSPAGLAHALLSWFTQQGLCICLQLRSQGKRYNFSSTNIVRPIESELLTGGETSDRIITFGKRYLFNEVHLSILVKNMPVDDAEQLGRLNDHIATICHSCDQTIAAVLRENHNGKQDNTLEVHQIKHKACELNEDVFDYITQVKGRLYKLLKVMEADITGLDIEPECKHSLNAILQEYTSNMEELDDMNLDLETKLSHFDQFIQNC